MERSQSLGAFVVHFRESTDIRAARVEGKVEHIASYRSARFHSLAELLAFVAEVLDDGKNVDGTPGGADGGPESQ